MPYLLVNHAPGALSFALDIGIPFARAGLHHGRKFHVLIPMGGRVDLCTLLSIKEDEASLLCLRSPQFQNFKQYITIIDSQNPEPPPGPHIEQEIESKSEAPHSNDGILDSVTGQPPTDDPTPPTPPEVSGVVTDAVGAPTVDIRPPDDDSDTDDREEMPADAPTPEQVAAIPQGEPNDGWSKEQLTTWGLLHSIKVSKFESKKKIYERIVKFQHKE